ncbi:unnamed protein product [Nesidiocoris tenuis]|uniref:Uncharacterized protein n=1 Tax=Nesidiocoris tenuis TaxID=355587 RepID=A0A6H5HNU3_9HEMI|nr:unnamed protein product [Nesidiocoris tenuis]
MSGKMMCRRSSDSTARLRGGRLFLRPPPPPSRAETNGRRQRWEPPAEVWRSADRQPQPRPLADQSLPRAPTGTTSGYFGSAPPLLPHRK